MELLDIYDSNGNKTGRSVVRGDKSVILDDDEHIAVGVIYIENSNGEFLIQKTSSKKGGLYSSTGGHICSGESAIESIKREVFEELGVDISNDEIIEIGFLSYDKPLRFMFYLKKDININDVRLQKDEVDFVKYMSICDIRNLINNKLMVESHGYIFEKIIQYKMDIEHK